jgi:REP element-mobilizing transposase RayT
MEQLSAPLDMVGARKQHGGRRPGAGRKKTGKRVGGPHRKRPPLSRNHAVHVTLRTTRFELRQRSMYHAIRKGLLRVIGRPDFRVVHVSIQQNHLHLVVEADHERSLSKGMQALCMHVAREINLAMGCTGKVFSHRYHAAQITNAQYARNVLSYVLNNWRRHRVDWHNGRMFKTVLDLYSTAGHLDGWKGRPALETREGYIPLPASPPRTSLLRFEWKQFGLLDPYARPGPLY